MKAMHTIWVVQASQCLSSWLQDLAAPDENAWHVSGGIS